MLDVYACRLSIGGSDPATFDHAVELALGEVPGGLTSHAVVSPTGSVTPEPDGVVGWRNLVDPDGRDRLWTLWWDRPLGRNEDLIWTFTAKVALDGGATWVSVHEGVRPKGRRLTPLRFDHRPLPLVGKLIDSFTVVEDGWRLSRDPAYAVDRAGAWGLAELLLDQRRVLPVVVMSRVSNRKGPVVDPDAISQALVGLAHVTVLDTAEVSFAFTDAMGPSFSVFGGSVRVYWPGLDRTSDPHQHELWTPARLAEPRNQPLGQVLLRQLAPAASFRLSSDELEARIRATHDDQRRAEIERLWAKAKEASLAPEWQDELERAWTDNGRLRKEIAEQAAQLATARANLRALVAYRPAILHEDDIVAEVDQEPTTIAEAVALAANRCQHLVFLAEAKDSARKASYRKPRRVLRALLALEEVAEAWSQDALGVSFYEAFANRGFDLRAHVSPTALGRFPHDYERTYHAKTISLGPHLALGGGSAEGLCRIYWYLDEQNHVFVVGHVGNHLSDSTTA